MTHERKIDELRSDVFLLATDAVRQALEGEDLPTDPNALAARLIADNLITKAALNRLVQMHFELERRVTALDDPTR